MAISLPQMRHVIAVAEAGSFRAAGERLGVQQSAISRSVREFEESLGAKVFDRRSTGAKLTPVGEHLMPEILTILDAIDGLALKARSFRPANAGRFALGLDLALSIAHIQPILTALRDDDSGLQITLVERSACEVVTAIQEGQVQLGLIRGRELPKGISARRFLVGDLFAVIPGDWLDDGEVIDHLRLGACPLHVASADIAADGVAKLRQVLGDGINLTSHDCTPSSLVGLVASGLGIGLTTSIPPEASAL
ncbi:LysR family transcriptional regulator, partial [Telmatospirillum sp.]|uniref:LysR family transcriptional regulator n=1 Tax=Telmatospirillum sp. TaxID=2079197 RepID=UPI00284B7B56